MVLRPYMVWYCTFGNIFCFGHENRSPGGIRSIFFPWTCYFFCLHLNQRDFPTRPKVSGKIKNVNLIKLIQKGDGTNREWHTSFFVLDFLNFKLLPIDSKLNSALASQTYFSQKIGCCTQNSSQTWKCCLKF